MASFAGLGSVNPPGLALRTVSPGSESESGNATRLAGCGQQALDFLDLLLFLALGANGQGGQQDNTGDYTADDHLYLRLLEGVHGLAASVIRQVLRIRTDGQLLQRPSQLVAGAFNVALDGIDATGHGSFSLIRTFKCYLNIVNDRTRRRFR